MGIPTILMIEDNFGDVTILRLALDRLIFEYRLEVLNDGEAALRYIADRRARRDDPTPCVILLDLHLPKYNGIQVLEAIKQDPVLTHLHVMVFTSAAAPADQVDVRSMGGLLREKPSDLKGFYDLAEEVVDLCTNSSATKVVTSEV